MAPIDLFKRNLTNLLLAGNKFRRGIVLYGGSDSIPLGKDLQALPIEALWRM